MTDILALDIGYGYTKAMTAQGKTMLLSQVGAAEDIRFESDLASSQGVVIALDGRWYFVGEYAELQSSGTTQTQSAARIGGKEQKALFYAVASELLKATASRDAVAIVTGLPVAHYNDRNKEALREMLKGEHVVNRRGRSRRQRRFIVGDIFVVPQAFGSLYSLVLDRQGRLVDGDLPGGRVGIIDVGCFTTNYLLSDRLRYVETGSGSIEHGMGEVLGKLAKRLVDDHGLDLTGQFGRLDQALRERAVEVRGARENVAGFVNGQLEALADIIVAQAETSWKGGADLRAVVLTGGGSLELAPYIRKAFPQTRMPGGDPQFANVTGFLRAGLRRFAGTG
jgi:plasmid segregation protein ParM